MIQTLSAIGSGNVATHLVPALFQAGLTVRQVMAHSITSANALASRVEAEPVNRWSALDKPADLYLVALPDRLIPEMAAEWQTPSGLAVHTAGSVPLQALEGVAPATGVLYPLQTFDKHRPLNLQAVPFFLEASDETALQSLQALAAQQSWHWQVMASEQRQYLHLAAILTNNFTTYLFRMAADQLQRQGTGFEALQPLIQETISKALATGPENAQTGPARRGDTSTLNQHQNLLTRKDDQRVYRELSRAIYRYFHSEE